MSFIKEEGKEIEVVVKSRQKDRSNNQNKYYWGVVVFLLSENLGFSSDEVHDYLRFKFLSTRGEKLIR